MAEFGSAPPLTPSYAPINQGASGTTQLAAASAGNKHKVLGFTLSLNNDGTVRFDSGVTPLTGNIKVDGQLQPLVVPSGNFPLFETGVNQALNIVTTQAAQGFIIFVTEP